MRKSDNALRALTLNLFILVLYCKLMMPIKNKGLFLIICFFTMIICLSINIKLYKKCFVLTTAILPVGVYTYISIADSYSYIAIFILSQTIVLTILYSFAVSVFDFNRAQTIVIKCVHFFWRLFTIQLLVIILIIWSNK